jgi:hypothetical protein
LLQGKTYSWLFVVELQIAVFCNGFSIEKYQVRGPGSGHEIRSGHIPVLRPKAEYLSSAGALRNRKSCQAVVILARIAGYTITVLSGTALHIENNPMYASGIAYDLNGGLPIQFDQRYRLSG